MRWVWARRVVGLGAVVGLVAGCSGEGSQEETTSLPPWSVAVVETSLDADGGHPHGQVVLVDDAGDVVAEHPTAGLENADAVVAGDQLVVPARQQEVLLPVAGGAPGVGDLPPSDEDEVGGVTVTGVGDTTLVLKNAGTRSGGRGYAFTGSVIDPEGVDARVEVDGYVVGAWSCGKDYRVLVDDDGASDSAAQHLTELRIDTDGGVQEVGRSVLRGRYLQGATTVQWVCHRGRGTGLAGFASAGSGEELQVVTSVRGDVRTVPMTGDRAVRRRMGVLDLARWGDQLVWVTHDGVVAAASADGSDARRIGRFVVDEHQRGSAHFSLDQGSAQMAVTEREHLLLRWFAFDDPEHVHERTLGHSVPGDLVVTDVVRAPSGASPGR